MLLLCLFIYFSFMFCHALSKVDLDQSHLKKKKKNHIGQCLRGNAKAKVHQAVSETANRSILYSIPCVCSRIFFWYNMP